MRNTYRHPFLTPLGFLPNGRPIYPIAGADGREAGNPVLTRLEQERDDQLRFIEQTLARVEEESRDLVDAEKANLRSARDRIKELDEQLEPLREFEELRDAHRSTGAGFRSTGNGRPAGDGRTSSLGVQTRAHKYETAGEFIADACRAARGDEGARDRLQSDGVVLQGETLVRVSRDGVDEVRAAAPHITTEELPGLLPKPIVGAIMSDVDAARPFISSVGPRDLGSIPGKVFSRPTVTQHVTVGKQAAEKAELPNRQFTVGGVDFTKDTYGGWANVSRQVMDWTSPAAWDALLTDFQEQYAIETEDDAADAFAASVTQTVELDTALAGEPTLQELLKALYAAASSSYAGVKRLPDTIWASLDWWQTLGALVDFTKATTGGDGGGNGSLTQFAGNLANTPRIIVPSFPAGTLIVGVRSRVEVYEDRIGFLSAVQPKVLGVELAYGGYMATGTIKPAAFTKIVNAA